MTLEDARELADEKVDSNASAGTTTIVHQSTPVNELKEHVGVSQNKQVAPLTDYAIFELLAEESEGEEAERFEKMADDCMTEFEEILEN